MKQRIYDDDDDEASDAQELLPLPRSARSFLESRHDPWSQTSLGKRPPRWVLLSKKNQGRRVWVGLAALAALMVVGWFSYEWWFEPERWESEGWYPSRRSPRARCDRRREKLIEARDIQREGALLGVGKKATRRRRSWSE
jgi:hypothetical protein